MAEACPAEVMLSETEEENFDKENGHDQNEQPTDPMDCNDQDQEECQDSDHEIENELNDVDSFFGIEAIDRAFEKVYSKSDPIVISSPDIKFWAGGNHPLDYIKVYKNYGNKEQKIHPHWHYVTYGFSDLHGDGRVHKFTGRGYQSGMGFELTFRLTEEPLGKEPPYWPIRLLDNLARYVFNTGVELHEYDHIPWHESLDRMREGGACNKGKDTITSPSLVRHMLIVEDPQILNLDTPHGNVEFLQIVGILESEFLYARSWRACAIIDPLLDHPQVGPVMVTDMLRRTSVFDLNPLLLSQLHQKVDEEGSHLGRVTAHFLWREFSKESENGQERRKLEDIEMNIKENDDACRSVGAVLLQFEPAAAELLPLMIRGRLLHGMPFTFSSTGCQNNPNVQSLQFVSGEGQGMNLLVNSKIPMRKRENFLQVWCSRALLRQMLRDFKCLEAIRQEQDILPLEFRYHRPPMVVSIVPKLHHFSQQKTKTTPSPGRNNQENKYGNLAP